MAGADVSPQARKAPSPHRLGQSVLREGPGGRGSPAGRELGEGPLQGKAQGDEAPVRARGVKEVTPLKCHAAQEGSGVKVSVAFSCVRALLGL